MAATLESPLLANKAAAAGDSGYQIEKSIRLDGTGYLSTTAKAGNRKTWTWSGWVKRNKEATQERFFLATDGNTHPSTQLMLDTTGELWAYNYDGSSYNFQLVTNAKFRDLSAWYHFVVAVDTTQSTESDRVKIFVNGERITSLSTANYPSQNYETYINDSGKKIQLSDVSSFPNPFHGYLADVHFIDGLALSPAAFGEFDSKGAWNPKAYALPAPNDGTTWSSGWAGTFTSGSEATKSFDGLLTTGSKPSNTNTITWTGDIAVKQGVRIYFECDDHSSAKYADIFVNGIPIVPTAYNAHWDSADVVNWGANNLTEIKTTQANNKATTIKAIEVDGVILRDGRTDFTTSNNPHDGTIWSNHTTANNGFAGSTPATKGFNGNLDANDHLQGDHTANSRVTFDVPGDGLPFHTLRIYGGKDAALSDANAFTVNGTDISSQINAGANWHTITGVSSPLTEVTALAKQSGQVCYWHAIELDGVILRDGFVNNSFQLKFNDTSLNRYLGKDTLNGKIADATGGLPIYNTTDAYGDVKGSGYRADSSAGTTDGTGLILAIPGDGAIADVHNSINTGSSQKTLTATSVTASDTSASRFYGSSFALDAQTDGIEVTSENSDFAFGTGDFTIEMWVNQTGGFTLYDDRPASTNGNYVMLGLNNTSFTFKQDDTDRITATIPGNNTGWKHLAAVRNSGTTKLYCNGAEVGSWSDSTNYISGGSNRPRIGHNGYANPGNYATTGSYQDVRVYKGVAKYTANFTPPTRNDFTVNNLTAGAETANAVFNWRPKASLTDDASAEDYAISNTGTTQSTTANSQKAHTTTITRTSGTLGTFYPEKWSATPPGSGTNGTLIYGGRSDTQWTFSPAVVSSSGNITARGYQDGGSTGADKIRFYDGSSWTAWFDLTSGSNYAWQNIATGVSTIEKVEFDSGGGTDPHLAGFYLNGGTADSDWWLWRNGEDFGITQAGWFEKDNGDAIITDSAVTIPTNYTIDYWACPEWSQKGNGTILDTAEEQTIRDYGQTATGNGTASRTLKITSTDGNTVYDYAYTARACRWHHVRITNTGAWVNGTQLTNNQASNTNVPNIAGSSHRLVIGNYTVSGGTSYSFNGLIGPVRIIDADLGAPPAGGLKIDDESGSSSDTPTNTPVTNNEYDYDSLVDSPTNYGTDAGAGGEVRGNYATLNPLNTGGGGAASNGNLAFTTSSAGGARATIGMSSGKWYSELTLGHGSLTIGITKGDTAINSYLGNNAGEYSYGQNGLKIDNSAQTAYGDTFTTGDTIGIAFDADGGNLYFYKNGTVQASGTAAFTGLTDGPYFFAAGNNVTTAACNFNFGQRAFKYTAPSDYKALCTQNLPDTFSGEDAETINNPSKYFDVKLFTGDDTTDGSKKIKYNFSPDLYWQKARSVAYHHRLFDRIRGQGSLKTNSSDAEGTDANSTLTTFDSDGVSIENTNDELGNSNGVTYVAWAWDAGTAAATPSTAGDITPSAQWVNATAGFSISKYTGTLTSSGSQSVGHGLSGWDSNQWMIISKRTDGAADWIVQHSGIHDGDHVLKLNTTAAKVDISSDGDLTTPTNTKWYGNWNSSLMAAHDAIAYVFTAVPGYSAFGKYTGTGTTDGAFIYTGFTPEFMIFKKTSGTAGWPMLNSEFEVGNPLDQYLYTHSSGAEGTNSGGPWGDMLSNGFKIRDSGGDLNASGETYIYAAFAEHPFKISRAR